MKHVRTKLVALLAVSAFLGFASHAHAQWRSVPYDAGNFAAPGSMTWTVEEADQTTFRYTVNDRSMTVGVSLETTSVGGTPTYYVKIKIPAGHKAASHLRAPVHINVDSGSPYNEIGTVQAMPNDEWIYVVRGSSSGYPNFQGSSNSTYIYFVFTFDIQ